MLRDARAIGGARGLSFLWLRNVSRTGLTTPRPTEVLGPYLPYISPTSPLHLPHISPISPLYLPHISPISPLYLPYLDRGARRAHQAARHGPAPGVADPSGRAAPHPNPNPVTLTLTQ